MIGTSLVDLDRIIDFLNNDNGYGFLTSEDKFKYAIEIQRNIILERQTTILNEAFGLDFPNRGEIPTLEGIVAELRRLNVK